MPQEPARPTPSRPSASRPRALLGENGRTSSRHRSQHGPLRPAPLPYDRARRWKKMQERRHATGASTAHSVPPLCLTTARAVRKTEERPHATGASTAHSVPPLCLTTPRAVERKWKNVVTPQEPARPTPSRPSASRPRAPLEENAKTSSRHRSQHGPLRPAHLPHDRVRHWKKSQERRHATGASTAHSVHLLRPAPLRHGPAHRWEKTEERRHATSQHGPLRPAPLPHNQHY